MDNKWKYSPIPHIEELSFNTVLERFYNLGILGLVRENIQNSLDGKIAGCEKPVIVTIKTGKISKEHIPGIEEVKDRINCLKGGNSYTKETIEHMKNKMDQDEVGYISFEDYNTKGLKGAINGQSTSKEDTWSSYAYSKGVHSEEADSELEKLRGGSHGIGKIASNAASDLYMMYFANCDEFGNKHLGGTVQLIEHEYKGKCYRSTGYFTDQDSKGGKFYPYENNFYDVFKKDTRGLKIIIPFLREQFNNENEIIKCVCDSFFIAILQKKLEVIINEKEINSKTIKTYIKKYYEKNISDIKDEFTQLYFDTYINQKPREIKIADINQEYTFNLYFNYNEEIPKGRVAIIRTIGMKIEDKKIKGNVNKPFNAVLIPNSIAEDAFLKSLENESHTELSSSHIKDQKAQKNAKRFINNISKEIAKIIEDAIKENNPTDGLMDTTDILYEMESQFKKDLSKAMPTVKLNIGEKKESEIVKIKEVIAPKEKTKKSTTTRTKKNSPREKDKNKDQDYEVDGENKVEYSVDPSAVERVIIGNNEFVKFDFSNSVEVKKEKVCNISLAVIDGMGVEYHDEFNISNSYERAIDKTTGKELKLEKNLIKNVRINKSVVEIKLELKDNFNKALKFVYYVEV